MKGLTNIKLANSQQLYWLLTNKCKHRHNYVRHFNCFIKDYEIKERVGFLDIETSNLKANFGIVLCWCILADDDTLYQDWLTKKDVLSGDEDKRVISTCIDTLRTFDRLVGHYSCLTPEHRVLTSDLRWTPASNLKPGDKLLAFEENGVNGKQRKFIESEVLQNIFVMEECCNIELDDGTILTCTLNHPFLRHDGIGQGAGHYEWKTAEQLMKALPSKRHNQGLSFNRILPVWKKASTFEEGWLSGFFDGEGSCCQVFNDNGYQSHYNFAINASQKPGETVKQCCSYLDKLGFSYSTNYYDPKNPNILSINILGGKDEKLRFLGQIRPSHLLKQFDINKMGALRTKYNKPTKIVDIKPVGKRMVCALGTTSETYFSEGFASHNTYFDIPFLRSRAIIHGLDFPKHGELYHTDVWRMAKTKLCLHSNRQDVIAESLQGKTIKTRISHPAWRQAMMGNEDAAMEVLDHCNCDVKDLKKNYNSLLPYCKILKSSI